MFPVINSSAGRQRLQGVSYAAHSLVLSGDFVKELLQREALNPNKCKAKKKGKKTDNGFNTSWGRVYLTDKIKKEPQRSMSALTYALGTKNKTSEQKTKPLSEP